MSRFPSCAIYLLDPSTDTRQKMASGPYQQESWICHPNRFICFCLKHPCQSFVVGSKVELTLFSIKSSIFIFQILSSRCCFRKTLPPHPVVCQISFSQTSVHGARTPDTQQTNCRTVLSYLSFIQMCLSRLVFWLRGAIQRAAVGCSGQEMGLV